MTRLSASSCTFIWQLVALSWGVTSYSSSGNPFEMAFVIVFFMRDVLIETEPNERREGVLKILLESALAIFLSSSATLVMLLVSRFLAVKCIAF
jgi:hypothetical protein